MQRARPGASPVERSADLGDAHRALQASGAGRRLHHFERMNAGLGRDEVGGVAPARREEGGELEAQRLFTAGDEVLLAGVYRLPRAALLAVLAGVERDGRGAVIGDEGAALTNDHALAVRTGHEVVGLHGYRHVAVRDRRQRHVVEAATEV